MIIVKAKKNKIKNEIELVADIRQELKDSPIAEEICKENGYDIDIIDGVSIEFSDKIESSARTTNGSVELNRKLLEENFDVIMRYVIHELVHVLQHMHSKCVNISDDVDYLDRPDEVEAFQRQIEYEHKNMGDESAHEYVEELLDYHEIPEHYKDDKKEELMDLVD